MRGILFIFNFKGDSQRFLFKAFLFAALPFILTEAALVMRENLVPPGRYFYHGVSQDAKAAPADFLFIGSSRVAAIDAEAFQKKAEALSGRKTVVRQVAMGCSTMAEHYLGLRHLLEVAPSGLHGCTVVIEAPGGLGDDAVWEDSWVDSRYPTLIAPYLSVQDVARLWRVSGTPWNEKIHITASKFSKAVYAFTKVRSHLYSEGEKIVRKTAHGLDTQIFHRQDLKAGEPVDLTAAAGIRADAEGVRLVRKEALLFAERDLRGQLPRRRWDRSITHDILRLVRDAGGEVIFFEMPLSSVQAGPLATPLRLEDKKMFDEKLKEWGSRMIRNGLAAADEDFPDLYHLRKSRNSEFSRMLAEAYFQ